MIRDDTAYISCSSNNYCPKNFHKVAVCEHRGLQPSACFTKACHWCWQKASKDKYAQFQPNHNKQKQHFSSLILWNWCVELRSRFMGTWKILNTSSNLCGIYLKIHVSRVVLKPIPVSERPAVLLMLDRVSASTQVYALILILSIGWYTKFRYYTCVTLHVSA